MKSKEERAADFARREDQRKAKYAERMGAINGKAEAAKSSRGDTPATSSQRLYRPSRFALMFGAIIPGLGQLQRAKLWKQKAELERRRVEDAQ